MKRVKARAKEKIYWYPETFEKDDIIYDINQHPAFDQLKTQDKLEILSVNYYNPETLHEKTTTEIKEILKTVKDTYILELFRNWEKKNTQYENGRKSVLRAINKRIKQLCQ